MIMCGWENDGCAGGMESCLECFSCLGLVEGFSAGGGTFQKQGCNAHTARSHMYWVPQVCVRGSDPPLSWLPSESSSLGLCSNPPPPPGLELLALEGCNRAGFALDLVWSSIWSWALGLCPWVWWVFLPLNLHWFASRYTRCIAKIAIAASEMLPGVAWGQPSRAQWLLQRRIPPACSLDELMNQDPMFSKVPGVKHVCTTRHHYQSGISNTWL